MLQRDFGFRIFKALVSLPYKEEKKDKKEKTKKDAEKKEPEKKDIKKEKEEENGEPAGKKMKEDEEKKKVSGTLHIHAGCHWPFPHPPVCLQIDSSSLLCCVVSG